MGPRQAEPVAGRGDGGPGAQRLVWENLNARLPVANPQRRARPAGRHLQRAARAAQSSVEQQRQFMAARVARIGHAGKTSRGPPPASRQQPTRSQAEYRETLDIVEQEAIRLSPLVDDMFTLTRADAGSYPIRMTPLTSTSSSTRRCGPRRSWRALFARGWHGERRPRPGRRGLSDFGERSGSGIPADVQPRIFERFYRVDAAQRDAVSDGGAGTRAGTRPMDRAGPWRRYRWRRRRGSDRRSSLRCRARRVRQMSERDACRWVDPSAGSPVPRPVRIYPAT